MSEAAVAESGTLGRQSWSRFVPGHTAVGVSVARPISMASKDVPSRECRPGTTISGNEPDPGNVKRRERGGLVVRDRRRTLPSLQRGIVHYRLSHSFEFSRNHSLATMCGGRDFHDKALGSHKQESFPCLRDAIVFRIDNP